MPVYIQQVRINSRNYLCVNNEMSYEMHCQMPYILCLLNAATNRKVVKGFSLKMQSEK